MTKTAMLWIYVVSRHLSLWIHAVSRHLKTKQISNTKRFRYKTIHIESKTNSLFVGMNEMQIHSDFIVGIEEKKESDLTG